MKKNHLYLVALGAMAFGLASCSSEEPKNIGPVDSEGIGYMSFTISSDQSRSRAEGDVDIDNEIFNNGDENEYAVCPNNLSNAALFFDEDGTFYGMSNLQAFNNTGMGHDETHDNNGYPEKYYTYITRWRNTSAKAKPTQVIVVLNANPDQLDAIAQAQTKLADVKTLMYETFDDNGNYVYGVYKYNNVDYFTMTNSTFFNGGDMTVTQISEDQVCETAEKALENPVTVYVERILAKFQLYFGENGDELTSNTINVTMEPVNAKGEAAKVNYVTSYTGTEDNIDYPAYTTAGWKAYIVNWAINGLEKDGYLIKKVGNQDYWNGWNNGSLHRSYWGESPSYKEEGMEGFTTQYRPTDYDIDADKYADMFYGNSGYWSEEDPHEQWNTLHYISFSDLKNRARFKYTAERTYSAEAGRKGYGPYRYASHYLIGAQLLIEGVDDAVTTTPDNTGRLVGVADKYYAYNFFWVGEKAKEDYIRYAYRRMATQVADGRTHTMTINKVTNSITGLDGTLYTDNQGTKLEVADAAKYFTTAPAQVIHGDGKVVLSLIEGKELYVRTEEEGQSVYTKLTDAQITNMIYTYSEPARHYNQGAMYYAIPVQHNQGKSAASNTVKIDKDSDVLYNIGQFGTVRNHWYRLSVKAINSIGTPVDDPDQPIIPDPEDEYYVALEIVILPWHVIDNGEANL